MSTMTMIASHHDAGAPILTNDYDKEFGEEILAVGRYKKDGAQVGQLRSDADNDTGRAHDADQSKVLHPDWRESSGIALPTVEELHYAHHFLSRAAERHL
jgi:hypothetical protein